MTETTGGRVYAGRSESERRADRRTRLVAAGLDLFGTEGWSATTVERLCSVAGVATRSFYEEFPGREALLRAVYADIMDGALRAILPVAEAVDLPADERIRQGLGRYVGHLTSDPRRARVAHHEVRVAGVLEPERQATVLRFAELIAMHSPRPEHGDTARILGLALAGAVSEVLVDWVSQPAPRPAVAPLVETLVTLYVSVLVPEAA